MISDLNWCFDLFFKVISQKYFLKSIFSIGDANDCLIFFKLYLTKSLLAFLPIYFVEKGFFSNVKSKWLSSQIFTIYFYEVFEYI